MIINPDAFSDMFWRQVKNAKLQRIRFHDLRHTRTRPSLSPQAFTPKWSQSRANITITLGTYSHAIRAPSLVAALVFER